MTSQQQLVCDSSTLANFKQWAQAISAFFSTAGWTQSSDTGQVNWSSIGSVPGSGAYVYEVWKPGDALAVFYLKVEYGNTSGTNAPNVRISLGTTTNGSGTLTGFLSDVISVNPSAITPPSTTTQYECNFSGDTSRMCVMLWRNAPAGQGQSLFAVERSLNSSGSYTGSYVTLFAVGKQSGNVVAGYQQSISLTLGAAPASPNQTTNGNAFGLVARLYYPIVAGSSAFAGSIPFDTCSPVIGYFDYPCTVLGMTLGVDVAEAVTFTAAVYGTAHTYLPSKVGAFSRPAIFTNNTMTTCMRYD